MKFCSSRTPGRRVQMLEMCRDRCHVCVYPKSHVATLIGCKYLKMGKFSLNYNLHQEAILLVSTEALEVLSS